MERSHSGSGNHSGWVESRGGHGDKTVVLTVSLGAGFYIRVGE